MRIGILQCDHVMDQFLGEFTDYSDMFCKLLQVADPKVSFSVYPVVDNKFPDSVSECDAWLITGSRHGTYDDIPWIHRLKDFIIELDQQKIKTVGICFGHQLLAATLGGESGKSDRGWGIGVQTWDVEQSQSWMQTAPNQFSMLASHQDQVSVLPPQAKLVAGSAFCPNASFQIENHILTFQGHPEFAKGYSRDLMESRRDRIPAEVIDKGLDSLQHEPDSKAVAKWITTFMKN